MLREISSSMGISRTSPCQDMNDGSDDDAHNGDDDAHNGSDDDDDGGNDDDHGDDEDVWVMYHQ